MESDFCVAALEEALERYGKPEIFNTDQGSQFTSDDFTGALQTANIRISMDGKGRWMDNVMIERLWRSLKYECIYLHAFETGSEVRQGLKHWIDFYNTRAASFKSGRQDTDMRHIGRNPGPATPDRLTDWRHNPKGFPPYFRRHPVRTIEPALRNRQALQATLGHRGLFQNLKELFAIGQRISEP